MIWGLSYILARITPVLVDVARDELPEGYGTEISVSVRSEEDKPISVASLTFRNRWLY